MHLMFWDTLLAFAALVTLPGTIELLIVSAGALIAAASGPSLSRIGSHQLPGPMVTVVPAHNEAGGIAATLRSLLAANPAESGSSVVVVADNCSDNTADIARAEGVRVLERHSETHRGKGYALDFAFRELLPENPEAFIVVDADASVQPGFFRAFREGFDAGADALQCAYLLTEGHTRREAMQELAFSCFNFSRPLARDGLGLSCGILGNGFGLRASTLSATPYTAASIVEDLEYHLQLVRSGKRVRFLANTVLRSPMPTRHEAAISQRARWEGGRLGIAARLGPRMAVEVWNGNWRCLEPLLDLLLLPLGYHVVVLATMLLASSLGSETGLLQSMLGELAWLGVAAVGAHLATAFLSPHIGVRHAAGLAEAPEYLVWKLRALGAILAGARSNAAWVRTHRDQQPPGDDSS